MQSIGDILRETRHAKQISLEDAARATKVKVDILEKLESDEYAALPGVTYTKGFLKIYAEHLGLDSQALVAAFIQSQGGLRRDGVNLETEANHRSRKPAELQLPRRTVIIAVAAMRWYELLSPSIIAFCKTGPGGGRVNACRRDGTRMDSPPAKKPPAQASAVWLGKLRRSLQEEDEDGQD